MYLIEAITNDFAQTMNLIIQDPGQPSDGTSLQLTMRFLPIQLGWFIVNLTYGDFVLNGVRITNSPNILHQFKNQIPFGIGCFSTQDREPSQQQDFASGASQLFLLNSEEIEQYAEILGNG